MSNLVVLLGLIASFASLPLIFPESRWVDWRFASRPDGSLSDDLVLVGLDEDYAERYGYAEPVRRDYLAQLIEALSSYRPSTIVLDVLVGPAETDTAGFAALVAATETAAQRGVVVVLPVRIGGYGANRQTGSRVRLVAAPPPPLDRLTYSGYVDFEGTLEEADRVLLQDLLTPAPTVRRAPLFVGLDPFTRTASGIAEDSLTVVGSLPFIAVAAHKGLLPSGTAVPRLTQARAEELTRSLGIPVSDEEHRSSDGHERSVPINYAADPTPGITRLTYYAAADLLDFHAAKDLTRESLRGKLVLIAAVFPSPDNTDIARTPFGTVRGGIIHLHAMDTFLRGHYPVTAGPATTLLLSLTLFAVVIVGWRRSIGIAAGWTLIVLLSYVGTGFLLFWNRSLLVPLALPLGAVLLAGTLGFIFHRQLRPSADDLPLPSIDHEPAALPSPPVSVSRVERTVSFPVSSGMLWSMILILLILGSWVFTKRE